jgi:hypothetical protein
MCVGLLSARSNFGREGTRAQQLSYLAKQGWMLGLVGACELRKKLAGLLAVVRGMMQHGKQTEQHSTDQACESGTSRKGAENAATCPGGSPSRRGRRNRFLKSRGTGITLHAREPQERSQAVGLEKKSKQTECTSVQGAGRGCFWLVRFSNLGSCVGWVCLLSGASSAMADAVKSPSKKKYVRVKKGSMGDEGARGCGKSEGGREEELRKLSCSRSQDASVFFQASLVQEAKHALRRQTAQSQ